MDIVGERILLARRRRGIQQKVLAGLAQISPKHLSQIRQGGWQGYTCKQRCYGVLRRP